MLKLLTDNLSAELKFEISFSPIKGHPLFDSLNRLGSNNASTTSTSAKMYGLSTECFARQVYATHDFLFQCGQNPVGMYYIVSGQLRYTRADANNLPSGIRNAVTVAENLDTADIDGGAGKNDWLCEQALWTSWWHLGDAQALCECNIVVVETAKFCKAVLKYPALVNGLVHYARAFVAWINGMPRKSHTDLFQRKSMRHIVTEFVHLDVSSDCGQRHTT